MKILPVVQKPCADMHYYFYKINVCMLATLQTYIRQQSGHWPLCGQILLVPMCLHPFPLFRVVPVPSST